MIRRDRLCPDHDIKPLGYQSQLLKRSSPAREENLVVRLEDTRSTSPLSGLRLFLPSSGRLFFKESLGVEECRGPGQLGETRSIMTVSCATFHKLGGKTAHFGQSTGGYGPRLVQHRYETHRCVS
jgi:hypothetical protein